MMGSDYEKSIDEPQNIRHQELPIEKDTKTITTRYLMMNGN